jgi:E3 ubiquitin-protein ligase listerin
VASIGTLLKEARETLLYAQTPELKASLFPHPRPWSDALLPFLGASPILALGVLRPFAGAVFLVSSSTNRAPSEVQRDTLGYSVPLRMALYTTRLLGLQDFTRFIPEDLQVQYLYNLALTYELVNDQLDLVENNMLFESHMDPGSMTEIRQMLRDILSLFSTIAGNARSWRNKVDPETRSPHDSSRTVRTLVRKFITTAQSSTPSGYYAGKALCRLMEILWTQQDWVVENGDQWLEELGVLNNKTVNIFGASAVLIGFGDSLRTSGIINTLCNRLISDIAGASPQMETLQKLVLLNACLGIYTKDDAKLPVPQNRVVFAVKQILSWSDALTTTHTQLASEACRALHQLLPAIRDVYGIYWKGALDLCAAIWNSGDDGYLSDERLPAVGMSLKLVSILQKMDNANDDLMDALVNSSVAISRGLVNLLKLQRSKENQPLFYVDDLLLRQIVHIDTDNMKDFSEFYPLVASDFRMVQSAAYDVLQRGLVGTQQHISVQVVLENTGKFDPIFCE